MNPKTNGVFASKFFWTFGYHNDDIFNDVTLLFFFGYWIFGGLLSRKVSRAWYTWSYLAMFLSCVIIVLSCDCLVWWRSCLVLRLCCDVWSYDRLVPFLWLCFWLSCDLTCLVFKIVLWLCCPQSCVVFSCHFMWLSCLARGCLVPSCLVLSDDCVVIILSCD